MSISVVIPTYNRLHTLDRALSSVFGQTRPAEEVIVVDDGSTDGTAAHIKARYPQVRLIEQGNHGVSHARNRGIEAASGRWLALLDSDDEWRPEKLAVQERALAGEGGYRVCHSDEIWIRNGRRVNPMRKHEKTGGWIFRHCLPLCAISPSAVLIHRSVFNDVGLFDESLPACEDYDLWLRVTARYPVLYVPQPLIVKYGGHADQLSRRHWGMDRFRIQALENILARGALSEDDRAAALAALNDKLDVLVQGARKRGNNDVLQCYRMKQYHYRRAG